MVLDAGTSAAAKKSHNCPGGQGGRRKESRFKSGPTIASHLYFNGRQLFPHIYRPRGYPRTCVCSLIASPDGGGVASPSGSKDRLSILK